MRPRSSPGTTVIFWRTRISCCSLGLLLRRAAELVAHAAYGLDQRTSGFELLAQVADVHVDRTVKRRGFAVVQVFHQVIARQHLAGGAHQEFENVELESRHLDLAAVDPHFTRAWIDANAVDFERAFL